MIIIIETTWICFNIDNQVAYSWKISNCIFGRLNLLSSYWGSMLNIIHVFEPRKYAPTTNPDTVKLFSCMIMIYMSRHQSKPPWKQSTGKFYHTCCIYQTLSQENIVFVLFISPLEKMPFKILIKVSTSEEFN